MSTFTQKTMRKIYFLWFFKQVVNRTTAKIALAVTLLWQLSVTVSIPNVLANMRSLADLPSAAAFMESALVNTEVMTLMLLSGITVVGLWAVRDAALSRRVFIRA